MSARGARAPRAAVLVLPLLASRVAPGEERFEVVVAGGGASGVSAAIAAARAGARTLLLEETPWLGGQLTAAGVSAIDGNFGATETGLFREFAEAVRAHYGGAKAVATGWVSRLCYEPRVGAAILARLASREVNLEVRFRRRVRDVLREGNAIVGLVAEAAGGPPETIRAAAVVDATELGEVLRLGGVASRVGRESKAETGEPGAPERADLLLQDFTWCAVLENYSPGKAPRVAAPDGHDPSDFACAVGCARPGLHRHRVYDWRTFITYRALPNGKAILNWGTGGNDCSEGTDLPLQSDAERERSFARAKRLTLGLVHHLQTALGHDEWGLADDEFETADRLPHLPYLREGRRVDGVVTLRAQDCLDPYADPERPLYQQAVAVGEYHSFDHHHRARLDPSDPAAVREETPRPPAYSVPFGALVPAGVDGILVAEKSLSVTHVVNGATRLHPVCMLAGQAAGVAAAIAVKRGLDLRAVPVREIQARLLADRAMLFPTMDVDDAHPAFAPIQRVLLSGAMRADLAPPGKGPLFRPDAPLLPLSFPVLSRAWAAAILDREVDPFRAPPAPVEPW